MDAATWLWMTGAVLAVGAGAWLLGSVPVVVLAVGLVMVVLGLLADFAGWSG